METPFYTTCLLLESSVDSHKEPVMQNVDVFLVVSFLNELFST